MSDNTGCTHKGPRRFSQYWLLATLLSGSLSPLLAQSPYDLLIDEVFEQKTLREIFQTLDTNYPVSLYYQDEWLPHQPRSYLFEQVPLGEVLVTLLDTTDLTFTSYRSYAVIIARKEQLSREYTQDYYQILREARRKPPDNLIVLGDSARLSDQEVQLLGTVRDVVTRETLTGAAVLIESLGITVASDAEGRFRLSLPESGTYSAEARFVGYESQEFTLRVLSSDAWDVGLVPEAFELDEVVIRETSDGNNVQSVQMGLARMDIQQIKEMPAFLGETDVVKSLLTLPGVSTVGEGATGFNVRGGNVDQNLIMQDEAIVFNASHALGFFSVFNPDAISEVKLYKGNIPAQYGGRLSSVLDVTLKGSNYESIEGKGGVGPVASRFLLEGPLVRDKTAFMIGARSSYSNWLLRLMENPNLNTSSAFFYDLNAKLAHRFTNGSTLSLAYYRSYDEFQYTTDFGFTWGTETATLNWNQIFNPQWSSSSTLVYGATDNSLFEPEGPDAFTLTNGPSYLKFRQNVYYTPASGHSVVAGAEGVRYSSQAEKLAPRNSSGVAPREVQKDDGQELAIYINDEFSISNRLSLSAGLRFSIFQQVGPDQVWMYDSTQPRSPETVTDSVYFGRNEVIKSYSGLAPRVSMRYAINPATSIKLSYNRLYQYIHLISNTTAAIPVDIWQVSNSYIPPQRADNYSLGYFRDFRQNRWETSLEIFYRDIDNIVEYKDLPQLLLNEHLETELLSGQGRAYGAELSLKRVRGLLTGWLSYTYSRSLNRVKGETSVETVNQGDWFPASFDQPHNMNIAVQLKVSRRSQFAFNFTYRSGRPITAPVANYFLENTIVPHYSARNQFRIPDYHRLDIAYTIDSNILRKRRFRGSFTFSLYNVYSRNNAFSVFFQRDLNSTSSAYKLSVLGSIFPSVTYNFEF